MNRNSELVEHGLSIWRERYSLKMIPVAEEIILRRDMVTLLQFVNENKVVGTQSTGNMPLKMIRSVTAQFVNPPILDNKIGDRVYRLRTENDVWPLYYLHVLAEVGGLLDTKPSRLWRVTKRGKDFLEAHALSQALYLLRIWWYEVNWLIAYPYTGMGDDLPPFFNYHVLESLLSLKPNTRISAEKFSSELIKKTGLVWGAPDSDHVDMFLQSGIERMAIKILASFGVLETIEQDRSLHGVPMSKLVSFKLTPFGRALLEALAVLSQ